MSFFSTTFGELFLVYSLANTLFFLVTHPLLAWVGSEIGQICGVFSSKDSKMHIFLTFFERLHPPLTTSKTKKTSPWGFAPNPTHLRGRRGRWQTLSTYPYGECCRFQGVKGKNARLVALDPSPSPWGSKTNRSGRSWKPVKACEAKPRSGLAFTG